MTDVVSFGPDEPPWRPARWLTVLGLVVLLGVVAVGAVLMTRGDEKRDPAPVAGPSCPAAGAPLSPGPGRPAALLITGACRQGSGLERRDRTAVAGPWTVVVRRPGGVMGRGGAVVTYPVPDATGSRAVRVGGVAGLADPGSVTWRLAGGYARVRGDLPDATLIAIAARTTVVDGRPAVRPPDGLTVVASVPYRAPTVAEVRYGTVDLGEQEWLGGGLTFTGVATAGGYEDAMYASRGEAVTVRGRPAVVSTDLGGNAVLLWEAQPGTVAYVGYSGSALGGQAVNALRRLAERSVIVNGDRWRALNPPVVTG